MHASTWAFPKWDSSVRLKWTRVETLWFHGVLSGADWVDAVPVPLQAHLDDLPFHVTACRTIMMASHLIILRGGLLVKVVLLLPLLLSAVCAGTASAVPQQPQQEDATLEASLTQPQADTATVVDRSRVVYVSDFELDLPGGKDARSTSQAPPAPTPASETEVKSGAKAEGKSDGKPEAKREDTPAERAAKFVDFVSNTLVKELERVGYVARRLRPGDQRPDEGIRISGVFAEPDEQNRLRRAMVGSPSVGQMALFVAIGNLARPDQALYAVVDPKTASNNIGPVITVSAYAPVGRFPMSKNATEKSIHDTAASIVAGLTTLLRTNVSALTR
jgi:hypothetical protein